MFSISLYILLVDMHVYCGLLELDDLKALHLVEFLAGFHSWTTFDMFIIGLFCVTQILLTNLEIYCLYVSTRKVSDDQITQSLHWAGVF